MWRVGTSGQACRSVAWHPTDPNLFASGGDDCYVRVWNLKERAVVLILQGHLDFVRSVQFHPTRPLLISSSDDQSVRIWDYQARCCVGLALGHLNYVMCVRFSPFDGGDFYASASLDKNIRVVDCRPLWESLQTRAKKALSTAADLVGSAELSHGITLQGHTGGVNWVEFVEKKSPTFNEKHLLSCGDDYKVIVWGWKTGTTLRIISTHSHNVSAAIFLGHSILSVSEDRTVAHHDRVFRALKSRTIRKSSERFWAVSQHPRDALYAAGHDRGLIVFKLERERPATVAVGKALFVVNATISQWMRGPNGQARSRRCGCREALPAIPPHEVACDVTGTTFMLTYKAPSAMACVVKILQLDKAAEQFSGVTTFDCARGCVMATKTQMGLLTQNSAGVPIIELLNSQDASSCGVVALPDDLRSKDTRPSGIASAGGNGNVWLLCPDSVVEMDVLRGARTKKSLSTLGHVRRVIGADVKVAGKGLAALLRKHEIFIVDSDLRLLVRVHETVRIKSGAWDGDVFVYSTVNAVKYVLCNGETGLISSSSSVMYIHKCYRDPADTIVTIALSTRKNSSKVTFATFSAAEYMIKKYLCERNFERALSVMAAAKATNGIDLSGPRLVSYLVKKGFAAIALHMISDNPALKFRLALKCGNLAVAHECAEVLNSPKEWKMLADHALLLGDVELAESSLKICRNFNALSFLYFITGHHKNLTLLTTIAQKRRDAMAVVQTAVASGCGDAIVDVLDKCGIAGLAAYARETVATGAEESVLDCVPPVLHDNPLEKWPTHDVDGGVLDVLATTTGESILDNIVAAIPTQSEETAPAEGDWEDDFDLGGGDDDDLLDGGDDDLGDNGGAGDDDWDDGDLLDDDEDALFDDGDDDLGDGDAPAADVSVGAGVCQAYNDWQANAAEQSSVGLAAATGRFDDAVKELAMCGLDVQFGPDVDASKRLSAELLGTRLACHFFVPTLPLLPDLCVPVSRGDDAVIPSVPVSLTLLKARFQELVSGTNKMQAAEKGKVTGDVPTREQMTQLARFIIRESRLCVATVEDGHAVQHVAHACRDYVVSFMIDDALNATEDPNRTLVLSALATHLSGCDARRLVQLLFRAVKAWKGAGHMKTAVAFANRHIRKFMEHAPNAQAPKATSAFVQKFGAAGRDKPGAPGADEYDPKIDVVICVDTLTQVLQGVAESATECKVCQAVSLTSRQASCVVCGARKV